MLAKVEDMCIQVILLMTESCGRDDLVLSPLDALLRILLEIEDSSCVHLKEGVYFILCALFLLSMSICIRSDKSGARDYWVVENNRSASD